WEIKAGHTTDREHVRICSRPRPTPATARHLLFELHPREPMARDFKAEDPGCANRQTRQHVCQAHWKAPCIQAQSTATSSAPRNRNISTAAQIPTSATTTAHGYMNNISTSKAGRRSKRGTSAHGTGIARAPGATTPTEQEAPSVVQTP